MLNTSIGTDGVTTYSNGIPAMQLNSIGLFGYDSNGNKTAWYPDNAHWKSILMKSGFINTTAATENIADLLGGYVDRVRAVKAIVVYYAVNSEFVACNVAYRGITNTVKADHLYGTGSTAYIVSAVLTVDWTNNKVTYNLSARPNTNITGYLVALF